MADTLVIHGLAVQCRLGVLEEEQERPQLVQIDLELEIDAARAARRDEVRDAIDYAALVSAVRQFAESKPYRLMETLAEDVASMILHQWATPHVFVRITKRALLGIDAASVEIARGR